MIMIVTVTREAVGGATTTVVVTITKNAAADDRIPGIGGRQTAASATTAAAAATGVHAQAPTMIAATAARRGRRVGARLRHAATRRPPSDRRALRR